MRSPWTALPGKEPALLERIAEVWPELLAALGQTGTMLLVAIPLAVLIGTPLGLVWPSRAASVGWGACGACGA